MADDRIPSIYGRLMEQSALKPGAATPIDQLLQLIERLPDRTGIRDLIDAARKVRASQTVAYASKVVGDTIDVTTLGEGPESRFINRIPPCPTNRHRPRR
jgi:hypothetical protein